MNNDNKSLEKLAAFTVQENLMAIKGGTLIEDEIVFAVIEDEVVF